MNLSQLRERVSAVNVKKQLLECELLNVNNRLELLESRRKGIDGAVLAIQEAAALTQGKLVQRFTDIVQTCLDVVFPDEYRFCMEFVSKRNKTEVDIWLDKNGSRMDPMTSNGGGVVDVISFALRIACLTISGNEKVILMDEPFKFIREDAKDRLGELVKKVSTQLGIQIIMVSDVSGNSVEPDRLFKVSKKSGVSHIEVV